MLWKLIENVANIYIYIYINLQQLKQTTKILLIIVLLHYTLLRMGIYAIEVFYEIYEILFSFTLHKNKISRYYNLRINV